MYYDQSLRMQIWIYNHSTLLSPLLTSCYERLAAYDQVTIVDTYPESQPSLVSTVTKLKLNARIHLDEHLSVSSAYLIFQRLISSSAPAWYFPYPELLTHLPYPHHNHQVISPISPHTPQSLKLINACFFPWACRVDEPLPQLNDSLYNGGELYQLAQPHSTWISTHDNHSPLPAAERIARNVLWYAQHKSTQAYQTAAVLLGLRAGVKAIPTRGQSWTKFRAGFDDHRSL